MRLWVTLDLSGSGTAAAHRVLTETGEIRQHVNIFVGSDDVKRLKGLQTSIKSTEIHIFNAVSGG